MADREKIAAFLARLNSNDVSNLFNEVRKTELPNLTLEKPAIPFRCPVCLETCWNVTEFTVSELDASNSLIIPYSSLEKSNVWHFKCGHKVKRVRCEQEYEEDEFSEEELEPIKVETELEEKLEEVE